MNPHSPHALLPLAQLDAAAWIPSLLVGASVALLAWWVIRALTTDDLEQASEWRYDVSRINALRRLDGFYRLFQPGNLAVGEAESSGLCQTA